MARDPYEVVLADLRAKRDEIDKLINSLEAFRPTSSVAFGAPAPAAPPSAQPLSGGRFLGASIGDASAAVLRDKGAPMGNAEIAEAIQAGGLVMNSAEPANTVSSVLHRAWQNGGDIVRIGRGTWGLKDWYPGQDMGKKDAEMLYPPFQPPPAISGQHLPPPPPPPPQGVTLTPELIAEFDQSRREQERKDLP